MKKTYSNTEKYALFVMVMLMVFTYVSMKPAAYNLQVESSFSSFLILLFSLFGSVTVLNEQKKQTKFSSLWVFWCLWLVFDFFILGQRGGGVTSIFYVTFSPLLFLLFCSLSRKSERIVKMASYSFIAVYAIAVYMVMIALRNMGFVIASDDEMPALNIIYWVVSLVPLLLLSEKGWIRFVTIIVAVVMVIVTGKRGAALSVAIILILFLFNTGSINNTSSTKKSHNRALTALFFIVVLYLIIDSIFEIPLLQMTDRFRSLSEDQGSGRIPIYNDMFKAFGQSSPIELIFGHGYGSIANTRHSTAHNDALQLLYEFGLIGLLVYILMLVRIIKRMFILRKIRSPYYLSYASSVVIAVVLGMVSGLVVFNSYFSFVCIFWGIIEGRMVADKIV